MESPGIWEAQKSTNPVYALSKIFLPVLVKWHRLDAKKSSKILKVCGSKVKKSLKACL